MRKFIITMMMVLFAPQLLAQQQLKLILKEEMKPNEINKILVDWKKSYKRNFKLAKQKKSKWLLQVTPEFTDIERESFVKNEINSKFELEWVEPDSSFVKRNKAFEIRQQNSKKHFE